MAKTEVYSWRLSPRLKVALEDAARRRGMSVSGLLEEIAEAWLEESRRLNAADEREQERIRKAAMKWAGSIDSGDPHLAENASRLIREHLAARYGR